MRKEAGHTWYVFSIFVKEDNFCDLLFAFPAPFCKGSTVQGKKTFPTEATYLFRVVPLSKGSKTI